MKCLVSKFLSWQFLDFFLGIYIYIYIYIYIIGRRIYIYIIHFLNYHAAMQVQEALKRLETWEGKEEPLVE
jgi:hypothetical protein